MYSTQLRPPASRVVDVHAVKNALSKQTLELKKKRHRTALELVQVVAKKIASRATLLARTTKNVRPTKMPAPKRCHDSGAVMQRVQHKEACRFEERGWSCTHARSKLQHARYILASRTDHAMKPNQSLS